MNQIILVGRAVRDPEIKYCQGEKSTAYGDYTLAVDRPYRKDADKETDFIRCRVLGRSAEFAEKYIGKGTKMIVRGRMQIDNWTDKDGNKRQSAYVFVEQQEFAESRSSSQDKVQAGKSPHGPVPDSGDGFMNIPDGIDGELPFN